MKARLLLKLASALVLCLSVLPAAQAVSPIALPTAPNGSVAKTGGFPGGSFSQIYTFTLGSGLFHASLVDGTVLSPFPSLSMDVQTGGGSSLGILSAPGSFNFTSVGGAYQTVLSGVAATPLSTFGFSISPVPEPEVWAMMLVGVGLVGFRLRQKSKKADELRFA